MPGFESFHPLAVSQAPGGWELAILPVTFHGSEQEFVIPVGATTDFASIPSWLMWLVDPDEGLPAAALHDHLWRVEAPADRISYRDADTLFRQALVTLGVDPCTCWLMWAGVRWGALTRGREGRRGWWRDAPRVLAISVPAMILVSAAALLLPAMLIKWMLRRLFPGRGRQIHRPAQHRLPPR